MARVDAERNQRIGMTDITKGRADHYGNQAEADEHHPQLRTAGPNVYSGFGRAEVI